MTKNAETVDPIVQLMNAYNADERPGKINLGIGVYQNDTGLVPIFGAVKQAEEILVKTQQTKTYVGVGGSPAFVNHLGDHIFKDVEKVGWDGIQGVGGSGALRIISDTLVVYLDGPTNVWLSNPSWPNHKAIFGAGGHTIKYHDYPSFEKLTDIDGIVASLAEAKPKDVIVLHACCHNPTGIDMDWDQWVALAAVINEKGLIPVIDSAYAGFGGTFAEDCEQMSKLCDLFPLSFCAFSCSKNLGLYRERVGASYVLSADADLRKTIKDQFLKSARSNYSMPPDHGSSIVNEIFGSEDLFASWIAELDAARNRISILRESIASELEKNNFPQSVDHVRGGSGLFALIPVTAEQTYWLQKERAIYMMPSGRINIAGIRLDTVEHFAKSCCDATRMVNA